ncbi:MAG: hypothetical protein N2V72_00650 [Methanophagales archaeon]|nr:hypothetical protein [Methanophagales archaeon]
MTGEMNKREKLIYLAGYIDCDGCISIRQYLSAGRKAYQLNLDISSTNLDIIRWLIRNFRGKVKNGCNPPTTCKPLKQWRLHDKDAYKLICDVQPYLLLKDRQAELAIDFYRNCIRLKQKGVLRPRWLISREETYHAKMHELNARGKSGCIACESHTKREILELTEREKLIYLASVIDAEGMIFIYHASQPSKNYYAYLLGLVIANTDTRLIDWLEANYGGWTSWRRYKTKNWKDLKVWSVGGEKTYKILKQVRPFLIVKQKQADLGMEFYRKCITNHTRSQWIKNKAYEYYLEMRRLNRRGVGDDSVEKPLTSSTWDPNQRTLLSFL